MESHQPELDDHEDPASLSRIYNVIKRFNRNTTWVATGLLGSVIFAALMVAFLDRQGNSDEPTAKASQSTRDLARNVKAVAFTDFSSPDEKQISEVVSEQPTSADTGVTPAINRSDFKPGATSQSQVSDKDSGLPINKRICNQRPRSSVRSRYVSVKARLIALWHQSLRREKPLGWNMFSNSNQSRKKRISYTAATSH
jgi:hypothetical protein